MRYFSAPLALNFRIMSIIIKNEFIYKLGWLLADLLLRNNVMIRMIWSGPAMGDQVNENRLERMGPTCHIITQYSATQECRNSWLPDTSFYLSLTLLCTRISAPQGRVRRQCVHRSSGWISEFRNWTKWVSISRTYRTDYTENSIS